MNELEDIFDNTQSLYSQDPILLKSCKNTRANSKLYLAENEVTCEKKVYKDKCSILISQKRSFEAAANYFGLKTAVLNFANSFNPGGGVLHGAKAQEECLCRCSTLYDSLTQNTMLENFYKKHCSDENELATDDVIYSPSVKVFKSDTESPKLLPKEKWFDVDVLTCAAPNLYISWDEKIEISDIDLFNLHEKRLRRILNIAVQNKEEVIILGAFGCGAFGNPPNIVASVAKKVLKDYEYAFKTVEFAIYCSPRESHNFEIFNKIINIRQVF